MGRDLRVHFKVSSSGNKVLIRAYYLRSYLCRTAVLFTAYACN
uniref:Uncharacterized protein n=1 Tax=Arundo donax TaxID=35708 RepID=A0A0A9FG80_ARUDO